MSKKMKSLDQLKKLKVEKKKAGPLYVAKPAPKIEQPAAVHDAEPDDDQLFFSAMSGVAPMNPEHGRQVDVRPEVPISKPPDPELQASKYMQAFLNGDIDFELEYTEEYMHGYVKGMDLKAFRKLKNGGLSMEAHMDMHGLNADQAYDTLLFFIRECYLQGKRSVLLITGRGSGSPGGMSVLKQAVQGWLTREPLRRVVLAFCTAQAKDGGTGALYVLLRKRKKTEGKVKWDRLSHLEPDF